MRDTKDILRQLIKIGYTEEAIAMKLRVHQSTISRILSGKIRDPRGSIHHGIKHLFEIELKKQNLSRT